MTRLRQALEARIKAGQKAFIPYVTAGDPSLAATERFVRDLAAAGADAIELGIPYSDPIADGPTNIKAAERALRNHLTLEETIEWVGSLRAKGLRTPIVLFSYFNPLLKLGLARFAALARGNGVDGVLAVDLPPEEAEEYVKALGENDLATVFLASPTTSDERLRAIDRLSTGFVYYVSRAGVTGVRSEVSSSLPQELERVRRLVKQPLGVGFGISGGEQARQAAEGADAVIVGSALVRLIEESGGDVDQAARRLGALASEIVGAIRGGRAP